MSSADFYFNSGENQQIETIVHISPDSRSAIYGYVKDQADNPIQDALVLLFETGVSLDDLSLSARVFTDELGQFVFGPLISNRLYYIKVYKNTAKIRELEIRPEI